MTPYYDEDGVTIYHGDCRELLASIDVEASVTITDPPYNGRMAYDGYDDNRTDTEYLEWLQEVFEQLPGDSLVYFPGTRNIMDAPDALGETWGFRRMLGWHKKEYAGDIWSGGPAMAWEPIVWAVRLGGEERFNKVFGAMGRDFLVIPAKERKGWTDHPCPKPLKVMDWLVGLFANPGDAIFDPFAGVGTTLLAAKRSGHRAIGVEQSERYCEAAAKRLAQGVLFSEATA